MIIIHENLPKEAARIAERLKELYGFSSQLIDRNLDEAFFLIPEFNGFLPAKGLMALLKEHENKKVLVLTPRDLYADAVSKEDDWVFGGCFGDLMITSTARMKCHDNKPSEVLQVPEELYMKRLGITAVHEIGHDVVHAAHYQEASWVNVKIGYTLPLGPHCTDNSCVMYQVVDIRAPPADEGHMLLGTEKRYDAGLDNVIERLYSSWFCDRCRTAIKIDDKYN